MLVKANGAQIVQYPYTLGDLRRANPRTSFPGKPDNLASFGVFSVADVEQPAFNAATHVATRNAQPTLANGVWSLGWTVRAKTAEEQQAARLAKLAELGAIRFAKEEGGTVFNGAPLATDRVTQTKLTAAYVKATANPDYVIADWKFAPGVFGTLNAATIIAAANAVEAHIQACFTRESELTAAILAANPEQLDAINLNLGWP